MSFSKSNGYILRASLKNTELYFSLQLLSTSYLYSVSLSLPTPLFPPLPRLSLLSRFSLIFHTFIAILLLLHLNVHGPGRRTEMPTGTEKTQNILVALVGVYQAGVCGIGEHLPYLTGQLPCSQPLAIVIM